MHSWRNKSQRASQLQFSLRSLSRLLVGVVVVVGPAQQEEAAEDAAAGENEQNNQDVDQRGVPEGEQVERLVTVARHIGSVLVVLGLINRVDPNVACQKWERNVSIKVS